MTNYDETAGTEDPQSLLDELHRIIELEDDGADLPEGPTNNEAWGDQHFRDVSLPTPAVVSAATDMVIPPQEPRPEARSRMIEAARGALAERREMNGLLPVLLRRAREDNDMTIADVAGRAALSEQAVRALEVGETEVNLRLEVNTTVAWIQAVPADRHRVLAALRRSLQSGWTGDLALAAGLPDRPTSVADYIDRVVTKLDHPDEEQAP